MSAHVENGEIQRGIVRVCTPRVLSAIRDLHRGVLSEMRYVRMKCFS